jgi:uncharacterized membrane protein
LDVGSKIQKSFDLYLKNFGLILGASLVVSLLSALTLGILAGPLCGGLIMLCLKLLRGEKAEFNEIFAYFGKFVPTFIVMVIMVVAMVIVNVIPILNIFLGLIFGPAITFVGAIALALVLDKNMEPVAAIQKGIELFMADKVMLWLYALVMGILSGIGVILLIIGAIFTAPLSAIGMAAAYAELIPGKESELVSMEEPPTATV